jgi:hypothetical protein
MLISVNLLVMALIAAELIRRDIHQRGLVDPARPIPKWGENIRSVAGNHTQVTAILAGFSINSVVLLATLHLGPLQRVGHNSLDTATIGLLTMDFFGYIATGILFSMTVEREFPQQCYLYTAASSLYYFSIGVSFTALVPLMEVIHYPSLRPLVLIMVLGATFGGYLALVIPLHDLFRVRKAVLLGVFAISVLCGSLGASLHIVLLKAFGAQIFIAGAVPICAGAISFLFLICSVTFFVRPGVITSHRFASLGTLTVSGTVAVLVYLVVFTVFEAKNLFPLP